MDIEMEIENGRPHVTPLLGNLTQNPHCILTTGCNRLDGLDLVVEGDVAEVSKGQAVQPDPKELLLRVAAEIRGTAAWQQYTKGRS